MSEKQDIINVEFRIEEVRRLRYWEDPDTFNEAWKKGPGKLTHNFKVEFNLNEEDETLTYVINIDFSIKPKTSVLGIRVLNRFKIKDLHKNYKTPKGTFDIPDGFLIHMLALSISHTRGMLAAVNTTPLLGRVYMPVLNAQEIYTGMQKHNSETLT